MEAPAIRPGLASRPLPMLPRVVAVEAEGARHAILATFETGERRRFDVAPLLDRGVFRALTDPEAFAAVGVDDMGGVVWASGADLSRDTVYLAGEPVDRTPSPAADES